MHVALHTSRVALYETSLYAAGDSHAQVVPDGVENGEMRDVHNYLQVIRGERGAIESKLTSGEFAAKFLPIGRNRFLLGDQGVGHFVENPKA